MNHTFLSNECCFMKINFTKKHYTDNRKGSPYHYIALLKKGKGRLRCEGETICLAAGDVFYIPLNIAYESFWSGAEIEWYSYGFSYFPETEHMEYKIQKINCDAWLKEELISLPTSVDVTSEALAGFYRILAKLIPLMSTDERNSEERIFRRSKVLMEHHTDWSIGKIAEECHVSYSTLYSVYKKVCGKTPNTVRQEILVQKAVFLLSTTDRSVQEISDALGFSSTSYFRKVLNQYTSCTPTKIRRNRKNML